jgi:hypothetical protein
MRIILAVVCVFFLAGCTMFPETTTVSQTTLGPTANELSSLTPGQWYRITNHEQWRLASRSRTELIGKLERSDGDSITLSEVSTQDRNVPPSPLNRIPYVNRLYENDATSSFQPQQLMTVPRKRIQSVSPISDDEARGQLFFIEAKGPSADEWNSLTPGQWYRVMEDEGYLLEDENSERGSFVRMERIGKLVRSTAISMTLQEVTSRNRYEPPLLLKWVSPFSQHKKATGVGVDDGLTLRIIGRESTQSITPISKSEAAELKRSFETSGPTAPTPPTSLSLPLQSPSAARP